MKTYSVIGLLSLIALFAILIYWLFVKPQLDSPKIALNGEVVSIKKMERSGDHLLEVREGVETKVIWYTFFDEQFDICIGDSLFKTPYGKLFVKCKNDSFLRLTKDQNILVSE